MQKTITIYLANSASGGKTMSVLKRTATVAATLVALALCVGFNVSHGDALCASPGANNSSFRPWASDDGSRVVYYTTSTNLVGNSADTIVLWNNGALVDVASGISYLSQPSISRDGSCVAFIGTASGVRRIYYYLVGGATLNPGPIISGVTDTGTGSWPPVVSDPNALGYRTIVWSEGTGGPGTFRQIYSWSTGLNLGSGPALVSKSPSGASANADCDEPSISRTASVIAFRSAATNLLGTSGPSGVKQIYVATGGHATEIDSVDETGSAATSDCQWPSISADGNVVAFQSAADLGLSGATGYYNTDDIFVRNRPTSTTTLLYAYNPGVGQGPSWWPAISSDGAYVSFTTSNRRLIDPPDDLDPNGDPRAGPWLLVADVSTTSVWLASHKYHDIYVRGAVQSCMDENGFYVFFDSGDIDIAPNGTYPNGLGEYRYEN